MHKLLISLLAMTLISLATPAWAEETHVLNCRLMTTSTPWLFRQHCKSDNFARLAVPDPAVAEFREKPKDLKKPYYKKKHAHQKDKPKHAYWKKKEYLKKKLIWKLHYLEKKLYAELRNCKKSYQCIVVVKRKLAKLYKHPAYQESPSALASVGTTTGTVAGTAGSLTGTAGNTLSGTTNTVGGLAGGSTGTVSGVAGGATNTVGNTATGATNTVGNTAARATNTVGGLLK